MFEMDRTELGKAGTTSPFIAENNGAAYVTPKHRQGKDRSILTCYWWYIHSSGLNREDGRPRSEKKQAADEILKSPCPVPAEVVSLTA